MRIEYMDCKEQEQELEEFAKAYAEAIAPSESEISEQWFKPLPNYVYPPNCGKRKRHSKRRARQYGRK